MDFSSILFIFNKRPGKDFLWFERPFFNLFNVYFSNSVLFRAREEVEEWEGVDIELAVEVEREGDGTRVGEGGRWKVLSAICSIVSFGETGTDRDLIFGTLLSALLRPVLFSTGFSASSSSSLVLFKEERGGGICSTSIFSSVGRFFFDCCFCCCFCCCFADLGDFSCCCCFFASSHRS